MWPPRFHFHRRSVRQGRASATMLTNGRSCPTRTASCSARPPPPSIQAAIAVNSSACSGIFANVSVAVSEFELPGCDLAPNTKYTTFYYVEQASGSAGAGFDDGQSYQDEFEV